MQHGEERNAPRIGRAPAFPPPGTALPPVPPHLPGPPPVLPPPYLPAAGSPPLPPPVAPPAPAPWATPTPDGWAPPASPNGWAPPTSPNGWAPPATPDGWAPPGPFPGPAPASSNRTVVLRLVLALVVLAAGVGAALLWSDGGDDHPSEWDPQVEDLAAFVEDTWGRDFDHPVAVNMLDADEYAARATGGEAPAEADVSEADDQAAAGRAFGLMEGDLDLFETGDAMVTEGTAAFYDPMTDEIIVNGTTLDVGTRVTLVHELTHALQAQVIAADGGDLSGDDTTDASDAFRALLEGDATVIEQEYAAQLPASEYEELVAGSTAASDQAGAALDEAAVPGAFQASFALPYALGAPWVDLLVGRDGAEGVEAALIDPPRSTSSMVDLQRSPDEVPVPVEEPEPAGEEVDTDRLGPMSWIVPLAEFTDGPTAFEAVRGWTGDRVVTSRAADGRVCVDAAVRHRDDASATRFEAASRTWFGQLPAEAGATATREGSLVRLHSCDPGVEADIALTGRAMDELQEVVLRNQLIAELAAPLPDDVGLSTGEAPLSVGAAACTADRLIATFGTQRLVEDAELVGSPELLREVVSARDACGG